MFFLIKVLISVCVAIATLVSTLQVHKKSQIVYKPGCNPFFFIFIFLLRHQN